MSRNRNNQNRNNANDNKAAETTDIQSVEENVVDQNENGVTDTTSSEDTSAVEETTAPEKSAEEVSTNEVGSDFVENAKEVMADYQLRFNGLGKGMIKGMPPITCCKEYIGNCGDVFMALRNIKPSNKDVTVSYIRDFYKAFKVRVKDKSITRNNYLNDFTTLKRVDVTQFSIFLGMVFEHINNPVLVSDLRDQKRTLDSYFSGHQIAGNKALVIEVMTKIIAEN